MVEISKELRSKLKVNIEAFIETGDNKNLTLENIFTGMDANNDTKITQEEMFDYFNKQKVTDNFSDDEMTELTLAIDEFQKDVHLKLNSQKKYTNLEDESVRKAYEEDMGTLTMDELLSYITRLGGKDVLGFKRFMTTVVLKISKDTNLEFAKKFLNHL